MRAGRAVLSAALLTAVLAAGCSGSGDGAGEPSPPAASPSSSAPAPPSTAPPSTAPVTPSAALPALPGPGALVLFFGDSYTAGFGATSDDTAYPARTAAAFGWVADVAAGPGTGFLNGGGTGQDYLERLALLEVGTPALVVLQGGLNDAALGPDAQTQRAATAEVLAALAQRFPGVPVVLLGPPLVPVIEEDAVRTVDEAMARAAADAGVPYVSPVRAGWDVAGRLSDGLHPDDAGHALVAERLAGALRGS